MGKIVKDTRKNSQDDISGFFDDDTSSKPQDDVSGFFDDDQPKKKSLSGNIANTFLASGSKSLAKAVPNLVGGASQNPQPTNEPQTGVDFTKPQATVEQPNVEGVTAGQSIQGQPIIPQPKKIQEKRTTDFWSGVNDKYFDNQTPEQAKSLTDSATKYIAEDVINRQSTLPQQWQQNIGTVPFTDPNSLVNQVSNPHGDPTLTSSQLQDKIASLQRQKAEMLANSALNENIDPYKAKKDIDAQIQQAQDLYGHVIDLQLVNRDITNDDLSAGRFDGVRIGLEKQALMRDKNAEQKLSQYNKGNTQALSYDERMMYQAIGLSALQNAKKNLQANNSTEAASYVGEKSDNPDAILERDNPQAVYQGKRNEIINNISNLRYDKDNSISSSIFGARQPDQEEVNQLAEKLGYTPDDLKKYNITPDDVKLYSGAIQKGIKSAYNMTSAPAVLAYEQAARAGAKLGILNPDAVNEHFQAGWQDREGVKAALPGLFGENQPESQTYDQENPSIHKPSALLGEMAGGIGTILGAAGAAEGISNALTGEKLLGAVGLGEAPEVGTGLVENVATANKIGNFASMAIPAYNDAYTNSLNIIGEKPEDGWKRQLYAVSNALINGGIMMIDPQAQIGRDIIGETKAGRNFIDELSQMKPDEVAEKLTKPALENKYKQIALETANHLGLQMAIPAATTIATNVTNSIANPQGNYGTFDNVGKAAVSGAISMFAPSLWHGAISPKMQTDMNKGLMWEMGTNPDKYGEQAYQEFQKGNITADQYRDIQQSINVLKGTISEVPQKSVINDEPLTPQQQQEYAWNLLQQKELNSKLETAKNKQDKSQINAIQSKLNDIANKNTSILNSAGEPTNVEKPENPFILKQSKAKVHEQAKEVNAESETANEQGEGTNQEQTEAPSETNETETKGLEGQPVHGEEVEGEQPKGTDVAEKPKAEETTEPQTEKVNGISVTTSPQLVTQDWGGVKGKPEEEFDDKAKANNENNPDKPVDEGLVDKPTGESFNDYKNRISNVWDNLVKTLKDNAVVVTHSNVIKLLNAAHNGDGTFDFSKSDLAEKTNDESTKEAGIYTFKVKDENGNDKTIYVVRHGETEDNLKDRLRTDDTQLTDNGRKQAENAAKQLSEKLEGKQPSEIVTSSLPRAVETSKIIAENIKPKESEAEIPQAEKEEQLKTEENASTQSKEQQQEIDKQSSIAEHARIEQGGGEEKTDETKNSNSNIGSKGKTEVEPTDKPTAKPTEKAVSEKPEPATKEPPFMEWKVVDRTISHSGIGKKLTKEQAENIIANINNSDHVKSGFFQPRYDAEKGNIRFDPAHKEIVQKANEEFGNTALSNKKRDAEIEKNKAIQKAKDDALTNEISAHKNISDAIDNVFGDNVMNDFNKLSLIKFINGENKKFEGQVNPKWRDGLLKIGALSEDGKIDFDKLKKEINAKPATKEPTKVEPEEVTKKQTPEKSAPKLSQSLRDWGKRKAEEKRAEEKARFPEGAEVHKAGFFDTADVIESVTGKIADLIEAGEDIHEAIKKAISEYRGTLKDDDDKDKFDKEADDFRNEILGVSGEKEPEIKTDEEQQEEAANNAVFSLQHAFTEAEREKKGYGLRTKRERVTDNEYLENAKDIIIKKPEYVEQLIDKAEKDPTFTPSAQESVVLGRKGKIISDELEEATNSFNKAKRLNTPEGDAEAISHQLRIARLKDQEQRLYPIIERMGSEQGAAFRLRAAFIRDRYTIGRMIADREAANGGKELTPEQMKEVENAHEKIQTTEDAYKQYMSEKDAKIKEQEAEILELRRQIQGNTKIKDKKSAASKLKDFADKILYNKADSTPKEIKTPVKDALGKIAEGLDSGKDLGKLVDDAVKEHAKENPDADNELFEKRLRKAVDDSGITTEKPTPKEKSATPKPKQKRAKQVVEARSSIDKLNELLKKDPKDITASDIQQIRKHIKDLELSQEKIEQIAEIQRKIKEHKDSQAQLEAEINKGTELTPEENEHNARIARQIQQNRLAIRNLEKSLEIPQDLDMSDVEKNADLERRIKEGREALDKLKETYGEPEADLSESENEHNARIARQSKQGLKALKDLENSLKTPEELTEEEIADNEQVEAERVENRKRLQALEKNAKKIGIFDEKGNRDPIAERLAANTQRARLKHDEDVLLAEMKNRSNFEKGRDIWLKWQRNFFKLSSPIVMGKLTFAAWWRLVGMIADDVSGTLVSKVLPKLSKQALGEGGGLRVNELAKSYTTGFMKGMQDIAQLRKTGKTDLEVLYGKDKVHLTPKGVEYVGLLHEAIKAPVKRIAFEKAMIRRTENYMNYGYDVSDPLVMTKISQEAYRDAERQVFKQDNKFAKLVRKSIEELDAPDKETGEKKLANLLASTAIQEFVPFTRVPVNIITEGLSYSFGSEYGALKLIMQTIKYKGMDNIPHEQADYIMRQLKKGLVGDALFLMGYFAANSLGGFWQKNEKKKEGEPEWQGAKIGNTRIPAFALENPAIRAMQLGATFRHATDEMVAERDEDGKIIGHHRQGANLESATAAAFGLFDGIPLSEQLGLIREATTGYPNEKAWAKGELIRQLFVPQFLDFIAKRTDPANHENMWDKISEPENLRQPKTPLQHVEASLPNFGFGSFNREHVPLKKKKNE